MDWRSREGQVLIAARAELTAHVGGNPSNVQKALIERAARLTLYIEMMDARGARRRDDERARQPAVSGVGQRAAAVLRDIGVDEAKPEKAAGLDHYLAVKRAAR